ncbi:MAG: hypothetical protein KBS69_07050 [Bacteroidales bacterium]|nr:hypothetical protein [Candidatus Colicola caccequi]
MSKFKKVVEIIISVICLFLITIIVLGVTSPIENYKRELNTVYTGPGTIDSSGYHGICRLFIEESEEYEWDGKKKMSPEVWDLELWHGFDVSTHKVGFRRKETYYFFYNLENAIKQDSVGYLDASLRTFCKLSQRDTSKYVKIIDYSFYDFNIKWSKDTIFFLDPSYQIYYTLNDDSILCKDTIYNQFYNRGILGVLSASQLPAIQEAILNYDKQSYKLKFYYAIAGICGIFIIIVLYFFIRRKRYYGESGSQSH